MKGRLEKEQEGKKQLPVNNESGLETSSNQLHTVKNPKLASRFFVFLLASLASEKQLFLKHLMKVKLSINVVVIFVC